MTKRIPEFRVTPQTDKAIVMSLRMPVSLLLRCQHEIYLRTCEGMISKGLREETSPGKLFLAAIAHYMDWCEAERAAGRSPLGLPPPAPKRPRGRPKKSAAAPALPLPEEPQE